ncbi:MAG: hypothetical protein IKK58_04140 [Clostridia bacterium]|nr:hypothetical protein [Clostridia bacterium]
MKKSLPWLIVAALVLVIGTSATVAYFVSPPQSVQNTFTVGSVSISLKETTGSSYKLIPGADLMKDPAVTVKSGSEACWLFVSITKSNGFDNYCTFQIREEWTPLAGVSGVYYRSVDGSGVDRVYRILKNDRVYVRQTLTEEELNAITVNPELSITAYAVQSQGVSTPEEAWSILNEE